MRIHVLQHVPFETSAYLPVWAAQYGHTLTNVHLYQSPDFPRISGVEMLIVLGGPMTVHEEKKYPWLKQEKAFIRSAVEHGKYVLGICLGAQLIACILNARVYPHRSKEIGWFPVRLTEAARASECCRLLPDVFTAFHWHGDTFDLPAGAVHLFTSEGCNHQGFSWKDNVLALQFHLEMDPDSVQKLLVYGRNELKKAAFVQSEAEIQEGTEIHAAVSSRMLSVLLNTWLDNPGK